MTLLSILADLNNVLVWTVWTSHYFHVLWSLHQSFGDCTKSTNYNWYNRHFHVLQISQFSSKFQLFIPLFIFFQLYFEVRWDSKLVSFLLIIIRSGLLAEIWWSVYITKSQRSLCVSFSRTDPGLCIYHLFVRSNFNFLHNS